MMRNKIIWVLALVTAFFSVVSSSGKAHFVSLSDARTDINDGFGDTCGKTG